MRICVIGSSRFPIREPFAGGLEAHTHALVAELIARGHDVTLFAAAGSNAALGAKLLDVPDFHMSEAARRDVGAQPEEWMAEHHAYLSLMMELAQHGHERYDVVLNASIHHLPIAMSGMLTLPLFTTLHTPPIGWIESAVRVKGANARFIAVSEFMHDSWSDHIESTIIHNGVNTRTWRQGPGGGPAVWFGRLVPEKGADLAIYAARHAGMRLNLAGPVYDDHYFKAEIAPHLDDKIRYLGHLDHGALRKAVGSASVSLVTPRWDEPYGLVAAEALAAGTPVAAFDRGAIGEIIDDTCGRLAPADDVGALAAALREASELSRDAARRRVEGFCSLDRMVDQYEALLLAAVQHAHAT